MISAELWERPLQNIPVVVAFFGTVHSGVVITLENSARYLIHKFATEDTGSAGASTVVQPRQSFRENCKEEEEDSDKTTFNSPSRKALGENEGHASVIVSPIENMGSDWKVVQKSNKSIRKSKVVHFVEACGTSFDLFGDNCKHAVERMMKLE